MDAVAGDEAVNDGTTLELPSDREILISRTFDAPARLVFEALTKAEHVKRWWAPRSLGVTLVVCEIDFRVGGGYRYVMERDGATLPSFSGTFLEIDPPTRVVQTEVFEPYPDAGSTVTVMLAESGGKTTMTSRSLYPSKEVRDMVLATGMEKGMRESMRQLTELVASLR